MSYEVVTDSMYVISNFVYNFFKRNTTGYAPL